MMAVTDALMQVAGPRAVVRFVQDVGAADPVDRRDLCVALNFDLDVEKEDGFAARCSLHRFIENWAARMRRFCRARCPRAKVLYYGCACPGKKDPGWLFGAGVSH